MPLGRLPLIWLLLRSSTLMVRLLSRVPLRVPLRELLVRVTYAAWFSVRLPTSPDSSLLAAAKEKSFEGMRGTLPVSWL